MSSNQIPKPPKSLFDLLSEELIIEILIRIPSKPLCRFKSVSKHFNSLISDPQFLPFYISRALSPCSWVILDRIPQIARGSTHPVRFQLVDRPKISTSAINPNKLALEPVTDPGARSTHPTRVLHSDYPIKILQSSNGLILFTLLIKRDPHRKHKKDPKCFAYVLEEESLYVVNPISNEWVGLPERIRSIDNRRNIGFTTRVDPETGLVDRFMVVEYQPGTLYCFVSDSGKWVEKSAIYMLGSHRWRAGWAFEFEGKLFWVDLSVGLITWDVKDNDYFREVESKEKAVCRFIPVPKGREKPDNTHRLEDERWVGVGGGFVQFMEVFKKGHCVLKLWRLENCEVGGEWSLMYEVLRENVERFFTREAGRRGSGRGTKMPKPCFVHPFEADVAYFETGDCIFSFNLRTEEVGNVDVFNPHEYVVPFVEPKWPSPIPKRLYAAYAKEEGNEYFKSQNFAKAIECYSKSIDLSPNTATFANRAMAYLKVNKYQEAENDCTASLKLDANYFKVYWRRAQARKELGNLTGALEDVEFGLKLEPENGNVTKLRAELKSMLEKVSSGGSDSDFASEVSACGGMDVKADGN